MVDLELPGLKTYILPEGEEDHQLDAQQLHERPVLLDLVPDLEIELEYAVHGEGHTEAFEDLDPNVRKSWVQRILAEPIGGLRYE